MFSLILWLKKAKLSSRLRIQPIVSITRWFFTLNIIVSSNTLSTSGAVQGSGHVRNVNIHLMTCVVMFLKRWPAFPTTPSWLTITVVNARWIFIEKVLAMTPPIGKLVQHITSQQIQMKIDRRAVLGGSSEL